MLLNLHFISEPNIELNRIEFYDSDLKQNNILVRGKDRGANAKCGTFQWTQAVKAFSLFFIKYSLGNGSEPFIFRGLKSSAASSFDYALGKPPNWLIELFGISANGDSFSRKLFKRSNPELKRPGPVEISINNLILPKSNVRFTMDQKEVSDSSKLLSIQEALQIQFIGDSENYEIETNGRQLNFLDITNSLKSDFLSEAYNTLNLSDIFTASGQSKTLSRIKRNLTLPSIQFKNYNFSNQLDSSLSSAERFGALSHDQLHFLQNVENINVALPAGQAGTGVIFSYLKNVKNINLNIDYNYQYGIEIMKKVINNSFIYPPDIICIGLAPAATLLNSKVKTDYFPLMVAPGMTHRLLTSKKTKTNPKNKCSELHLLLEDTSTSQMYYELLKGVGELKDERVKLVSAPPNQIYDALHAGDKDISAINFFPYYNLNEKYNNSQIIDSGIKELNTTESVIFVHQSLTSNKILLRCLSIAIRDAWLTLAEGGSELNQTVSSIFEDKNLLRLICRFGGLINHNQI